MTDPITAYLANGGTITKCPPGYAAYGWTRQCATTAAPSDVCQPDPLRNYKQVQARKKLIDRLKPAKAAKPASERKDPAEVAEARKRSAALLAEMTKRKAQERRAKLKAEWDREPDVAKLAERHSTTQKRMRALLREAGVLPDVLKPPRAAKSVKVHVNIRERDAKVVAMLTTPGVQVQAVADAFKLTVRTVRRIAKAQNVPARVIPTRLTDDATRRAIAAAYVPGVTTYQALADRFGVSWDAAERAVRKYRGKK